MVKIEVVICARDEERFLPTVLDSLKRQTFPPATIIVVDDGSKDRTSSLAEAAGCKVVRLPRKQTLLGLPALADTFNAGLQEVSPKADYVLVLGADHPLPPYYVRAITDFLDANGNVVMASGKIAGEGFDPQMPRNSGCVVRCAFWRSLNGMSYPRVWGYEVWLVYKARMLGLGTVQLGSLESRTLRSTKSKGFLDGVSMKALGYPLLYAVGRSAKVFTRVPGSGVRMLAGYLMGKRGDPEVAKWVRAEKTSALRRTLALVLRI